MTICVAAISEKDKVIAVTDKMLTLDQPITTTFEITDSNKVSKLTDKSLALFAGNVIHANEILKRAREKIDGGNPTVLEAAEMVKEAFSEYWESVVSNYLFMRYRIDLPTFMQNQQAFEAALISQVNEVASKFSIDVQILVAGVDSSPSIYYVDNTGSLVEQTPLGYACIGSGQQHAVLSMIESEYNSSFDKSRSIYALLEAKKRAEYDPGVGKNCDMAIIDTEFRKFGEGTVEELTKIFDDSQATINSTKQTESAKMGRVSGV